MNKSYRFRGVLALVVVFLFHSPILAQCCPEPGEIAECQELGGVWKTLTCSCYGVHSPIVIDVAHDGLRFTNVSEGVHFDFAGTGSNGQMAWTAPVADDAFLVLDRNHNGLIDDGTELFGNLTPQPPSSHPNGFAALVEFDQPVNGGNWDGMIDSKDRVFSFLQLWRDSNHNGISEAGELFSLPDLGVVSISLDYRESRKTDDFGNVLRYRSKVNANGPTDVNRWAYDVFLKSSSSE